MTSKSKGLPTSQRPVTPSAGSAGVKPPQPQTQEDFSERRREPRYPTRDPVEVENALGVGQRLAGFVLDVSRSGLRLELNSPIGKGSKVKITFPSQIIVFGDVRYCRSAGTVFHAGVLIERVLYTSQAAAQSTPTKKN